MNIEQVNFRPQSTTMARPAVAGPAAAPLANANEPASARVTNFAQTLAADASSIKGMGAKAMGGQGNSAQQVAPTLVESGFDMDRAFQLTSTKLSAGKSDGADLFAAAIASSTGE